MKRKTGEGADEVYVSKWPHYNSLKFLDDIDVLPKPSISNLEVSKCHACMVHDVVVSVIILNHNILPRDCSTF